MVKEQKQVIETLYELARELKSFYLSGEKDFDKAGNLEYLKFQTIMKKYAGKLCLKAERDREWVDCLYRNLSQSTVIKMKHEMEAI